MASPWPLKGWPSLIEVEVTDDLPAGEGGVIGQAGIEHRHGDAAPPVRPVAVGPERGEQAGAEGHGAGVGALLDFGHARNLEEIVGAHVLDVVEIAGQFAAQGVDGIVSHPHGEESVEV